MASQGPFFLRNHYVYTPSERTLAYLASWLAKAERYQTQKKHRRFELTLTDFMQLWGDKRLAKLDAWIIDGMQGNRMKRGNPFAFVLGWKDRAAIQTGGMNIHTAAVITRLRSELVGRIQKGEKHTPSTIQKMRKPKSEEHKRKMSEAAKARWALARFEKENS